MHQPAIHPENITADLARRAVTHPDTEALVIPGRSFTFSQLDTLVWQAAAYFHECGVRNGHVVATLQKDDLIAALTTLGLARLGASVARLASSSTRSQLSAQLDRVRANFIVSEQPDIPTRAKTLQFDESLLVDHNLQPPPAPENLAPVFLLFGSGSTGDPKIMVVTAQTLQSFCHQGETESLYRNGARVLLMFGLEFAVPMIRLLVLIHNASTLVLTNHKPLDLVRYCRQQQVTLIQGVVMHFEQLLVAASRIQGRAFPTVQAVRVGGSVVSSDLRSRIRQHIAPVVSIAYAANECGVITELLDDGSRSIPLGSVGHPVRGVEVQITSPTGQILGADQAGMICARTSCVIAGYQDDPSTTEARFRNGWFITGDLGRFTQDGELIYLGRADAMMVFNGINIYPAEIENCLKRMEDISDIHVFSLRHPVHQDIPACAVTVRKGSLLSEADIIHLAQDQLGFKAPKMVLIVDSLPRTLGGKLQRSELDKLLQNELQKRRNYSTRSSH